MHSRNQTGSKEDILNKFRDIRSAANEHVELEIRFNQHPRTTFTMIYNHFKALLGPAAMSFERSINTFTPINDGHFGGSRIRQQIFATDGTRVDNYVEKFTRYNIYIKEYIPIKIALSIERKLSTSFTSPTMAEVRLKHRVSFKLSDKWRLDMTAVKSSLLKDISSQLVLVKNSMFPTGVATTPDNYMTLLDNSKQVLTYEFELEYIGNQSEITVDDLNITKSIYECMSSTFNSDKALHDMLYVAARFITSEENVLRKYQTGRYGVKKLVSQSEPLTINRYNDIFPPDGYFATDKADGIRCLCIIDDTSMHVLTNTMTTLKMKLGKSGGGSDIDINHEETGGASAKLTICDCELIKCVKGANNGEFPDVLSNSLLLVFDVIAELGEDYSKVGFSERVKHIESVAKMASRFMPARAKRFTMLSSTNLKEQFTDIWNTRAPEYDIDGIIVTEPNKVYLHTMSYKWKPTSHITIDFLAIKPPNTLLGTKPFVTPAGSKTPHIYALFCGITYSAQKYFGLNFMPQYDVIMRSCLPEGFKTRDECVREGDLRQSCATHYPIQFSPSIDPTAYVFHSDRDDLNCKIIELSIELKKRDDITNFTWKFVKIREDRQNEPNYYGNEYYVAESDFQTFFNPLEFEHLWDPPHAYFMREAPATYRASNAYRRYVMSTLIAEYLQTAEWLIDLGCGRGADLGRYIKAGIKNTLFVDVDGAAISELIERKHHLMKTEARDIYGGDSNSTSPTLSHISVASIKHIMGGRPQIKPRYMPLQTGMRTHVLVQDLLAEPDEIHSHDAKFGLPAEYANGVIMNFSFHYMCKTQKTIKNICETIRRYLRVGGVFIATVMDGEKIHEILKTANTFELREPDAAVVKYGIKKQYTGTQFAKFGQMISIKIPFSADYYDEPLVNMEYVKKVFCGNGFEVVVDSPLDVKLIDFARKKANLFAALTDVDKKYIELQRFIVMKRIK